MVHFVEKIDGWYYCGTKKQIAMEMLKEESYGDTVIWECPECKAKYVDNQSIDYKEHNLIPPTVEDIETYIKELEIDVLPGLEKSLQYAIAWSKMLESLKETGLETEQEQLNEFEKIYEETILRIHYISQSLEKYVGTYNDDKLSSSYNIVPGIRRAFEQLCEAYRSNMYSNQYSDMLRITRVQVHVMPAVLNLKKTLSQIEHDKE